MFIFKVDGSLYQKALDEIQTEKKKRDNYEIEIAKLKDEVNKLKIQIEDETEKNKKEISDILSKSIDQDLSDFLEMKSGNNVNLKKKDSTGLIKDKETLSNLSKGLKTDKTSELKHTNNSITNPNIENTYKETIQKIEEDNDLMLEQNKLLKKELKEAKIELEKYKRLYKEQSTLGGDKIEHINMLAALIERLILEVTLNKKIKEIISTMMRILNFTDNEISEKLEKKKK